MCGASMATTARFGRQQSFGRREAERPATWVRPATAAVEAAAAPVPVSSTGVFFPFCTVGLVALLTAIFFLEFRFSPTPGSPLAIDGHAFVALGGVGRTFVFAHHEWWRFFTAPWLHGGVDHLAGNAITLVVAGTMLERLIGRAWLAAAFFVGAWGGSIGSLALSGPNVVVSLGASGAIMGLVALLFTLSFHSEATGRARRYRRVALGTMIPALLPSVAHNGVQIDIGAHFGGAAAGTAVGFLLLVIWPETGVRPPHVRAAIGTALVGVALTIGSFLIATTDYPAYAEMGSSLAPTATLQSLTAENRTDELVRLYPHDPAARLARASQLVQSGDDGSAVEELRVALDERDALTIFYTPQLHQDLQAFLAVILDHDHRSDEARTAAAELCPIVQNRALWPADDDSFVQELDYLKVHAVCD
jgi:rhomboid protease GluP